MESINHTIEKAQKAQFEAESKFKLVLESMSDYAFFMLDIDGHVSTWNIGAQNVHGISEEEILGRYLSFFYNLEDINNNLPQKHIDLAKKFNRYEEELWMRRNDGRRFWARFIITSFRESNGEITGFAVMIQDLTKYKLSEDKLRQSEEVARRIFEGIKDYAIYTLDLDGKITSWNEGATRIKGYSASEVSGRSYSLFYLPEEVAIGKCAYELSETLKTGRYEEEGWRLRKDGTCFWASVVFSIIRDEQNRPIGFTKITRDMTDRKRAEDLLKMSFADLEKTIDKRTNELVTTNLKLQEAIKIRDDFLSIASHELKTPLTPLKLQVQMLEKSIKSGQILKYDETKIRKVLDVFETSVNRLSRLIDNLLDVSRISHNKIILSREKMNLKPFLDEFIDRYRSTIELSDTHIILKASENVFGYFDPLRIEQVFSNLLTNALKYGDKKPIEVSLSLDIGKAVITFKDHGIGIPQEKQKKIFERYEKIEDHRNISGLGLGLYITKDIIDSHGGDIEVISEVGKGSVFKVTLPLN